MKKENKDYDAWKQHPDFKTEASFLSYLRSKIRGNIWREWKLAAEFKKSKQVKITPEIRKKLFLNNRMKVMYPCNYCTGLFKTKEIQVDHIEPCGALTLDDMTTFILNLLCGKENFQLLCKECHDVKTHMDRGYPDMEYAAEDLKRVAFTKLKVAEQIKYLMQHKVDLSAGCTKTMNELHYRKLHSLHLPKK